MPLFTAATGVKPFHIHTHRGRSFPSVAYFSTANPVRSLKTPLAVLVNQGTASAAEIVSGAVQVCVKG